VRPPANVTLLLDLADVLRRRRLKWYVFGAQAASYYGRPRMTEDVDVTVRVPEGRLRGLVAALAKATFVPRVDDVEAFVARARVIPFFHRRSSMPLDLVIAADGLEEQFLERAIRVDLGGVKVPILSPEDVVITKVLAGRPQDLLDVRSILDMREDTLDLRRVRRVLADLDEALGDVDLVASFEVILKERRGR